MRCGSCSGCEGMIRSVPNVVRAAPRTARVCVKERPAWDDAGGFSLLMRTEPQRRWVSVEDAYRAGVHLGPGADIRCNDRAKAGG